MQNENEKQDNNNEMKILNGNGNKDVEAMVARCWNEDWTREHLGFKEQRRHNHETKNTSFEQITKTFLQENYQTSDATIFYTESGNITLTIVCQRWQGPVPVDVIDRDVLSIGTIWGFCVGSENDAPLFGGCVTSHDLGRLKRASKMLLQRAIWHFRDTLRCHKVVALSLFETATQLYRDCGFESKNMLTRKLDDSIDCGPPQTIDIGHGDTVRIQPEGPNSDAIVVDHWKKMWRDVGIPADGIVDNMKEITLGFIENARRNLKYRAFVARQRSNGSVLGSICCQVWDGPCPQIVPSSSYGTIWAVYVHPEYRRKGIATVLMKFALHYLHQIGCKRAILLAASEAGQRVYERLGFAPNNALVLDLKSGNESRLPKDCTVATLSESLAKRLQSAGFWDLSTSVVTALVTATAQQLAAVFARHPRRTQIIEIVVMFQTDHELYIDPEDNWFTQNVNKFGKGFDMQLLRQNEAALARKFDRLAEHYDHWTVGNRSKVERFIASCANRILHRPGGSSSLRALDVACGIGLQGQTLRMCGFAGELVGTDVSPGMIARVLERGCYNHAFVANANHGFPMDTTKALDDLFDVVICTGAMELLDQATAVWFISSMMKEGGEAWLSFQQDSEEAGVDSTSHQNVKGIKKVQVDQLLSGSGLQVVSIESCPDAFYTPSPRQDGSLLPVPYLFVVAQKK